MAVDDHPWTRDLGDVRLAFDGYWVWVESKQKRSRPVSGKYLFFCADTDHLQEIALTEIRDHGFQLAKYNLSPLGSNTERVLCLYYENDSRKSELAERAKEYGVKYRYWKSDVDTDRGRYSPEFLAKLSPQDRARFTRDEVQSKTRDAAETIPGSNQKNTKVRTRTRSKHTKARH